MFEEENMLDSYRTMMYDLILTSMKPYNFRGEDTGGLLIFFKRSVEYMEEICSPILHENIHIDQIKKAIAQMIDFNNGGFHCYNDASNFYPLLFHPLYGVGHCMVLGFNKEEAVLFNVGYGSPSHNSMFSWKRKERKPDQEYAEELYTQLNAKKYSDIKLWHTELYKIMGEWGWGEKKLKYHKLSCQKSGTCMMKSIMAAIRSLDDNPIWGRSIKLMIQMSATFLILKEFNEKIKEEKGSTIREKVEWTGVVRSIQEHVIPKFAKHIQKDDKKNQDIKIKSELQTIFLNLVADSLRTSVLLDQSHIKKTLVNTQYWPSPKKWPSLHSEPLVLLRSYFSLQTFSEKYLFTFRQINGKEQAHKSHPIVMVLLNDLLKEMTVIYKESGFEGLWELYKELDTGWLLPSLCTSLINDSGDKKSLGLDFSLLGDRFRQMTAMMMIAYHHLSWFFYVKTTCFDTEELTKEGAEARFDFYYRFFLMFQKHKEHGISSYPLKHCMESSSVQNLEKNDQ